MAEYKSTHSALWNDATENKIAFREVKKSLETGELDKYKLATSLHDTGQAYMIEGNLEEAESYFSMATKMFAETNDQLGLAFCLGQHAVILRILERREEAEQKVIESVVIAKKLGLGRRDTISRYLRPYFLNLLVLHKASREAKSLRDGLEEKWNN